MIPRRVRPGLLLAMAALVPAGCAIHPAGEDAERDRNREAGKAYEDGAAPPALPDNPGPEDYLRYAFFSNADLQARYWGWRAALEQIPQDASFPNAALSFGYLLGGPKMKAWDRTTLGISNEPMSNIPFPTKPDAAGRRALEEARAAGLRFEAAKFQLQGRVLTAYYDLALLAETLRIQEERVALLRMIADQSATRVRTGSASSRDLLGAQTAAEMGDNELQALRSRVPGIAAKLNALVGRPAGASVPLPAALPAPRPLPVPDGDLIRLAAERSPELAALARDVASREEALGLAKQAYIPDFGLSFSITGSVEKMLGGMLTVPLRLEAIRAGIDQAEALLKAATAARTKYERDLAASFVLNLAVLRDTERQAAFFEGTILPRARQAVDLAQTSYAANRGGFAEILAAQGAFLDTRLVLAQLRMEREKVLAVIETWAAVDVEVMSVSLPSPMGGGAPSRGRNAGAPPSSGAGAPEGGSTGMGGMK
jgi:cobalt-zinc-cadmium efflux system outer membrane protein